MRAERPHLELYLRWMEQRAYAPATIGRRFATVAGFYRYAVIDGHAVAAMDLAGVDQSLPLPKADLISRHLPEVQFRNQRAV